MKIKAIADRIFVRLEPEAEKTSGGVLLVSDIPEPRTVGVVESVGGQVKGIKPGDRVLFPVWGGWPAAQLWARQTGWTGRRAVIWRRLTRICSARRKVPVWAAGIKRQNLLLS